MATDANGDIIVNIAAEATNVSSAFQQAIEAAKATQSGLAAVNKLVQTGTTELAKYASEMGITGSNGRSMTKSLSGGFRGIQATTKSVKTEIGNLNTPSKVLLATIVGINNAMGVAKDNTVRMTPAITRNLAHWQDILSVIDTLDPKIAEAVYQTVLLENKTALVNGNLKLTDSLFKRIAKDAVAMSAGTAAGTASTAGAAAAAQRSEAVAAREAASANQSAALASSKLAESFGMVAAAAAKLPSAMTSLAKVIPLINGMQSALMRLNATVIRLIPGMKELTGVTTKAGQSFYQFRAKLFTALMGISMATMVIGRIFDNMSAQIEQVHQFTVAFGELADQVTTWTVKLEGSNGAITESSQHAANFSNILDTTGDGIADVAQYTGSLREYLKMLSDSWQVNNVTMIKAAATFQSMTNAMGITGETGMKLSTDLTTLAMDMASLWDVDVDTAFSKFQSALAGQTRAIRTFGLDITEASLVEENNKEVKEGLSKATIKSVDSLTRADKTILIHNAIVRQASDADGDWARSIETPANRLRVLKEQLLTAAQDIGALFIPAIQAVLPVLTALTKAVIAATAAIASFFGMDIQKLRDDFSDMFTADGMDTGGIDGISDSLDSAADATGSASKAAKEYQKQLLGFDEINNLTTPTDTGGGGGSGGGGGGADLGLKLMDYETTIPDYKSDADKVLDTLKNALKSGGWNEVGKVIGQGLLDGLAGIDWTKLQTQTLKMGSDLASLINGGVSVSGLDIELGATIGNAFNTGLNFAKGFVTQFDWAGFGTFVGTSFKATFDTIDWTGISETVYTGLNGLFASFDAALLAANLPQLGANIGATLMSTISGINWSDIGQTLADGMNSAIGFLLGIIESIDFSKVADDFLSMVNTMLANTDWVQVGKTIMLGLEGAAQFIMSTIFNLETWFNLAKAILQALYGALQAVFENPAGAFDLVAVVSAPFTGLGSAVVKAISKVFPKLKNLTKGFKVLKDGVANAVTGAAKTFSALPEKLGAIISKLPSALKQKIVSAVAGIVMRFSVIKRDIANIFTKVGGGMLDFFRKLPSKLQGAMTKVKNFFTKGFGAIKTAVVGIFNGIKTGIVQKITVVINAIKSPLNGFIDGVNGFIDKVNGIEIPLVGKLNIPKIPRLATGGIVDNGQMFIAREAGPELVGNIGSKTSVMNNTQIVSAVSQGVAQAVASVLSSNKGNNDKNITISVKLDGREIIKSINSAQRVAGRTLLEV